jgi:AAA domain
VSELPELRFVPVAEFAAVDEPGAEPLATATVGGVVIPAAGTVIVYGDGGAGKTTLVVDLCFTLAAGEAWLDIVTCERPLRVALVENEGPRQEFRDKIEAKLGATGFDLGDRFVILEEPWAEVTLADETDRRALALALVEHETDLLVIGPLVSAGEFPNGGTPEEIRRFEEHVTDLRQRVERPFALLVVHHENRAGRISGAWERLPDTLVHVTAQGNGRTRVFWQKARWSSAMHGTISQLVWADGESYEVEDKPEVTSETMRDELLAAVAALPGGSWTKIRDHKVKGERVVRGNTTELAAVRDRLVREGLLVNTAAREGQFQLWLADDPTRPRSEVGTAPERATDSPPPNGDNLDPFPVPVPIGNGENGNGDEPEPDHLDQDEVERLADLAREAIRKDAE